MKPTPGQIRAFDTLRGVLMLAGRLPAPDVVFALFAWAKITSEAAKGPINRDDFMQLAGAVFDAQQNQLKATS